jgi:hypothetical protein
MDPMRKCVLGAAVVALLAGVAAVRADVESDALLAHIRFLASDELKGRGNGTDGLERAAEYVAQHFQDAGLQPAGTNGSWFQPFEIVAGLSIGRENRLSIEQGGKRVSFALGTSYYPLAAPSNETPAVASAELDDLPLVFAGYGLVVPSPRYDDYANVDVNGKAVLIFSHEPQERDRDSRFNGARPIPQTSLQAKAAAARTRGARALLVVSDPSHQVDEAPYGLFAGDPDAENHVIPVLRVRRDELQPLIDAWGLDAIAAAIDKDLQPRSKPLPGATVDYVEHLSKNRRTIRNVVGMVPGSDPARAGEAVVIGAHYDHVGVGGRFSAAPDATGQIHNGADDNASGTAAIIEMARAVREQRARFPRSIVFVAFAGEERGLLGSAFYANAPAIPIEKTVAMINLDMVGRSRGAVDVSGLELSPSMEADLNAAAKTAATGLDIRRQGPGAGRSDDSSFIAKRIPAINFFTGFHTDYHRPSDDWEKIDADGTKRVATLALELAARLAARRDTPEFVQPRR